MVSSSLSSKVAYRGWTSGGELRQASFKRLRE
jgi:ATP-dependent DNA ligase